MLNTRQVFQIEKDLHDCVDLEFIAGEMNKESGSYLENKMFWEAFEGVQALRKFLQGKENKED